MKENTVQPVSTPILCLKPKNTLISANGINHLPIPQELLKTKNHGHCLNAMPEIS